MSICPEGHEVPVGQRFCGECGVEVGLGADAEGEATGGGGAHEGAIEDAAPSDYRANESDAECGDEVTQPTTLSSRWTALTAWTSAPENSRKVLLGFVGFVVAVVGVVVLVRSDRDPSYADRYNLRVSVDAQRDEVAAECGVSVDAVSLEPTDSGTDFPYLFTPQDPSDPRLDLPEGSDAWREAFQVNRSFDFNVYEVHTESGARSVRIFLPKRDPELDNSPDIVFFSNSGDPIDQCS